MPALHIELTEIFPTQLVMIGSHETLGWWDPSKGSKLEWSADTETWRTQKPISLTPGIGADGQRQAAIDYKFVRMIQGQCQWEGGPNRVIEIPAGAAEFNINAEFNGKAVVKLGNGGPEDAFQAKLHQWESQWAQEERRAEKTEEVLRAQLNELQLEISRMRENISKGKEAKEATLAEIVALGEAEKKRKADAEAKAIEDARRAREALEAEKAAELARKAAAARAAENALAAKVAQVTRPLRPEDDFKVTEGTATSILQEFVDPLDQQVEKEETQDHKWIYEFLGKESQAAPAEVHETAVLVSDAADAKPKMVSVLVADAPVADDDLVPQSPTATFHSEDFESAAPASEPSDVCVKGKAEPSGDIVADEPVKAKRKEAVSFQRSETTCTGGSASGCLSQNSASSGSSSESRSPPTGSCAAASAAAARGTLGVSKPVHQWPLRKAASGGEISAAPTVVRRRRQLRKTFERAQRSMPNSRPSRGDNAADARAVVQAWIESEPDLISRGDEPVLEAPEEGSEATWAMECLASARHRWHYIGDDPHEAVPEPCVDSEMLSGEVPALLRELRRLQHGYDEEANAAAVAEAIALEKNEELGRLQTSMTESQEEVCVLRSSLASTEVALSMERLETADLRERVERLLGVVKDAETSAATSDKRSWRLHEEVQEAQQATADEVCLRKASCAKLNDELSLLAGDLDAMRHAYLVQVQRTQSVQAAADEFLEELRDLHSRGLAADAEASQERDVAFAALRAAQDQLTEKDRQMQVETDEVQRLRGEIDKQHHFHEELMQLQAGLEVSSQERDAAISELRNVQSQLTVRTREVECESQEASRLRLELEMQQRLHEEAQAALEAALEAERATLANVQKEKDSLALEAAALAHSPSQCRTLSNCSSGSSIACLSPQNTPPPEQPDENGGEDSRSLGLPETEESLLDGAAEADLSHIEEKVYDAPPLFEQHSESRSSSKVDSAPSSSKPFLVGDQEVESPSVSQRIVGFQARIAAALQGQQKLQVRRREDGPQRQVSGASSCSGCSVDDAPETSHPPTQAKTTMLLPNGPEVHLLSPRHDPEEYMSWQAQQIPSSSSSHPGGRSRDVPTDDEELALDWLLESSPGSDPRSAGACGREGWAGGLEHWRHGISSGSSGEDRVEGRPHRPGPPGKPPLLPERILVPQRSRQRLYRPGMLSSSNRQVLCQ
mmetsp:Transcript_11372/g.26255  ORF Transcript_11372/g.26255 Transcript_11372/m.26255 type:complete len:1192 (-) Transcript_11372:159-3734(-)